jgi:hypothetical protein
MQAAKSPVKGNMMKRTWNSGNWNTGTWDEVLPKQKIPKRMQVKTNVSRISDAAVIQLGNNIIAGATGKTELADSPLTLAELQTLVTAGSTARNQESLANDAAALKLTARVEAMAELRAGINRYAEHADTVYDGDKLSLQAIGLDVRDPSVPLGPLPAPANLRSRSGAMEGTVELEWDAITYGRPQYFVECAQSASGPWTQVSSIRVARTVCGALTPGAEYFFRVRAQGAAGDSPWSDITKRRAS